MYAFKRVLPIITFILICISDGVEGYNQSVNLVNNNTICFQNYDKKSIFDKFLFKNKLLIQLTKFSFLNFGAKHGSGYIKISLDGNEELRIDDESSNFQVPVFLVKAGNGTAGSNVKQLNKIVRFYHDYEKESSYECSKQSGQNERQFCNVFAEETFQSFSDANGFKYRLLNQDSTEIDFDIDGFDNYCVFSKAIHSKGAEYYMDEKMPGKKSIPIKISNEIHNSLGNLKIFEFLNNVIIAELFAICCLLFTGFFLVYFICKLVLEKKEFWNILTTYSVSYIPVVFVQLYLIYFDVHLFNYVHYLIMNNFSDNQVLATLEANSNWKTFCLVQISKFSDFFMAFLTIFLNNFIEIFLSMVFAKGYGFWINNVNIEKFSMKNVFSKLEIIYFMSLNLIEFLLLLPVYHSMVDEFRIYLNIAKESILLFAILNNYFNQTDFKRLSYTIENILYSKKKHNNYVKNCSHKMTNTIINDKLGELNLKLFIKNTLLKYNKTILLLLVKLFFQISLNFIELGFIDSYQETQNSLSIVSSQNAAISRQNIGIISVFLEIFNLAKLGKLLVSQFSCSTVANSVTILNRQFEEERIVFVIHCLKNAINILVNFLICLVNISFEGNLKSAKLF